MEFATLRAAQNIVILLIIAHYIFKCNGRKKIESTKNMFLSTYVNFLRRIPLT